MNGHAKDADVENGSASSEDIAATKLGLGRGMVVTWKELTYTVTNSANRKEKLKLLDSVNGFLLPGCLTALMGPSGSGKTTLLDILAGRKTVGRITGSLLFSGQAPTKTFLRRYTGYTEQFDTLIANLTVAEMLAYTADMKSPADVPADRKRENVDKVIASLGLDTCRHVRIGDNLDRGISGGQAKRTNIGLALVTRPRVLFLDEPTSGLDSFTANEVMTVVKGLVSSDITICTTIHSPTPYCFGLFDTLLILLQGHVAYFGANGSAALSFFEMEFPETTKHGSTGDFTNPAEWIVDLTTKGRAAELAAAFAGSQLAAEGARKLDNLMEDGADVSEATLAELATQRGTTVSFFRGILYLWKHRTTKNYRDGAYLGPRLADKILFGALIFALFWHIGKDHSNANVNNLVAVLFMLAIMPGYTASAYVPNIVLDRPLYLREHSDGLYLSITYLCWKMLEELMIMVVTSCLFTLVVFYSLELAGSYMLVWITYFLTTATGVALGYFVGTLSPNMAVANAALPAYVTALLFFAGLFIRPLDMPDYLHWAEYITFLHYSWSAFMINQFQDFPNALGYGGIPVLEFYSMDKSNKWAQVGYLSIFFFVFMFLSWFTLAFKRHQKR